ncbi:hypothetical protein OQH61_05355 [Helicobacter sp. MIT 21-1697]|uniref:hypothetical protein n=1 Tax=Helicobacter sp. MIT 21-1697 TaxID=2993733 RepID=UPI00224AE8EB|nr:hypothetical protein [Helicobacter sp. MIT 21-1697]MCX2717160.1 hypothetical protein [Helicobacter sp. MIT 21-1697]
MREKNYWPHAIVGILLFGVFMVSVSITIAMKNPIQDENTYFAKKRIVDENINDIIKEQNLFSAMYDYSIYLSNEGKSYAHNTFVFPYNAPSHRPDIKSQIPPTIIPPNGARIHIEIEPKTSAYSIENIHLFLDSMHEAHKIQDLGEIENVRQASKMLNNLLLGRWKFVLEITYKEDSENTLREPKTHKAYFESEVFIKDVSNQAVKERSK